MAAKADEPPPVPRPSKNGVATVRVYYMDYADDDDYADFRTDSSWTVGELLPRALRRRKMHNWGIEFGFRYKKEDQRRLCYPLQDVCKHFTVADLAMAGPVPAPTSNLAVARAASPGPQRRCEPPAAATPRSRLRTSRRRSTQASTRSSSTT